MVCCFPTTNTTTHDMIKTTTVRIAVPKLESIFCIPTFPSKDVKLAKTAESKA